MDCSSLPCTSSSSVIKYVMLVTQKKILTQHVCINIPLLIDDMHNNIATPDTKPAHTKPGPRKFCQFPEKPAAPKKPRIPGIPEKPEKTQNQPGPRKKGPRERGVWGVPRDPKKRGKKPVFLTPPPPLSKAD